MKTRKPKTHVTQWGAASSGAMLERTAQGAGGGDGGGGLGLKK